MLKKKILKFRGGKVILLKLVLINHECGSVLREIISDINGSTEIK